MAAVMRHAFAAGMAALLLLCAAAVHGTRPATGSAGDDWPVVGGDADNARFSALTDIAPANVARLGFAWSHDLGTDRVQEATPVVIGGVMYASGNLGRVTALDAATGRELWSFTPDVDMQVNGYACCDQANRGVAVAGGKVFVAALDGVLYALDARTGAVAWKTDTLIDRKRGYTITGAPTVAGDVVVIGNAGAEYDTRGYVTAYGVGDGRQAWRFFTVPHDPRTGPQESPALTRALETWDPASRWDIGGGGTAWDAITYDRARDTIYVGVGNGGPYPVTVRSPRGGDNLYLSSLVALDRRTGALKWHFQETPGDSWDFTATAPMVLTDITVDGRRRSVILHAPKNGFLFVIDRDTGRPLRASALVRTSWATGYDLATGRPRLTPGGSDYMHGPKVIFPASVGARSWFPPAWDAGRGLYFASVLDMGNLMFVPPGATARRAGALNTNAALVFTPQLAETMPSLPPAIRAAVEKLPEYRSAIARPYVGEVRAIEPLTGKTRWAAPTDGWQDRMGMLATASGLVVHGTIGGHLIVRDAGTGRVLKDIDTGSAIMAAPMTYRVNGVQYVAVATGFGGGGWPYVPAYSAPYRYGNANRLLAFRLDGGPVAKPAPLPALEVAPPAPAQADGVTPQTIATGRELFYANCSICHANQPRSTSPDLRRLDQGAHQAFRQIVLQGALVPAGMPRWDDLLTPQQVDAIHAYLTDEQSKLRARELRLKAAGKPLDAPGRMILSNF